MPFPEPQITETSDEAGTLVTVRYETPETARMVTGWSMIAFGTLLVVVGTCGGLLATRLVAADANNMWLVASGGAAIAAFALARVGSAWLSAHRFFARWLTDHVARVHLERRSVTVGKRAFARGGVLRFTAAPHRIGRLEERGERVQERLMPTTYRDAWQVWLQHGESFVLIADVSDEKGAEAFVRALQAADEQVMRGAGPERLRDGMRQLPV